MARRRNLFGLAFLAVAGVLGVALSLAPKAASPDQGESRHDLVARLADQRRNDLAKISLAARPSAGRFISLSASLRNGNSVSVKNVEVTCLFLSNNRTVLDRKTIVIYETLGPGQRKNVGPLPLGTVDAQSARYQCDPTDFLYS